MTWITLRLTVATPLFSYGANQLESGVRVPSLRGAMRFWFRALAGSVVGNDLRLLAELESAVFGSTERSSPVKLRIPKPPAPVKKQLSSGPSGLNYLRGMGLADGADPRSHVEVHRAGFPSAFDLMIRFTGSEEASSLALASLWLTCTYGGLGSRVRRGFGGLRITEVDKPLPGPWTPETLRTPGPEFFEALDHLPTDGPLTGHREQLAALLGDPRRVLDLPLGLQERPSYPVLGLHTRASLRPGGESCIPLLERIGTEWRHFRMDRETTEGRRPGDIRSGDNRYPLGALGLPVVYDKTTSVRVRQGTEELRRASPIWLRPVGTGSKMQLFSFAFLGDFLPPGPRPVLWKDPGAKTELVIEHRDLVKRAERWIFTMREGGTFVRDDAPPRGGRAQPSARRSSR
ncbi:type III-B CRISPR module RAMP protein Cmr1 [Streptomyces calidiresistens]|uniref:Type III-B CRISPR module RAMP protein Cmr1 n=1 Tax=Streptomyces calidiresistens TaxID=1485586 RepID=A0A7W3XV27_9ACTN|nr:type III-B CRISPR module RAMP protein Cmr1 [Streptomyces calidiresistens]MBB0228321.1 type III-B CRISPR module RAMP protein Cmr1 [Streptomyces calidiresistens]